MNSCAFVNSRNIPITYKIVKITQVKSTYLILLFKFCKTKFSATEYVCCALAVFFHNDYLGMRQSIMYHTPSVFVA